MLWRCSRRPWPTKGRIVTSHNDKAKWQPWFFEKPCNFSPRCLLKQKRSGRLVLAGLNYLCFWGKNWFWLVLTIFVFLGLASHGGRRHADARCIAVFFLSWIFFAAVLLEKIGKLKPPSPTLPAIVHRPSTAVVR